MPIAGHAHWAEVGGGIVFVAPWEFTGFHLNAPVAQRVISTEGSLVIGSVVKTLCFYLMCSPRCAAALGTYGLISNHNIRTRWTRSSFDSNSLIARCDNLDDAVQVLRNARNAKRPHRNVWSEAGDMVRTVSLCGLLSMSPLLFFFLDVCAPFVSVNADAPILQSGTIAAIAGDLPLILWCASVAARDYLPFGGP